MGAHHAFHIQGHCGFFRSFGPAQVFIPGLGNGFFHRSVLQGLGGNYYSVPGFVAGGCADYARQGFQGFLHSAFAMGAHHAFYVEGNGLALGRLFRQGCSLEFHRGCWHRAGSCRGGVQLFFQNGFSGIVFPFLIVTGVMELEQVQPQSIHAHGEAGHAHGGGAYHGVHLVGEQAGGQGNADHVVEEGPEQVLVDVGNGAPAQPDSSGHIGQAAVHQDDISGINGHVGTGANSDTNVSPGQGRGVVDAVPYHGYGAKLLELADHGFLAFRQDAGHYLVHPGLTANGFGSAFVIPGQHDHGNAHVLQFLDGFGGVFLNDVGYGNQAGSLAICGKQQRGFPVRGQFSRFGFQFLGCRPQGAQVGQAAPYQFLAAASHFQPVPGQGFKIIYVFSLQAVFIRFFYHSLGQRMLGFLFQVIGQLQQTFFGIARGGHNIRYLGLPFGNGTGFIQGHNGDLAGSFQGLGGFEQDTVLGTYAAAHHNGYRGCQAQGAGAGDNQHRNPTGNGLTQRCAGKQPAQGGDHGHPDDGGDEYCRNLIRNPGNGGLGGRRIADQFDNLAQGGVFPYPGSPAFQVPGLVHGGGGNLVPRVLVHRQAFARQGGFVYRRRTLDHHTVHRDIFPRAHGENVADLHIINGDRNLLAVPEQHRCLGSHLHQPLQGIRGPALGHGLQHLP